jgi:hypothetical protein
MEHVGYEDWSNGRLKTKYRVDGRRPIDRDEADIYDRWLSGCSPLYRIGADS